MNSASHRFPLTRVTLGLIRPFWLTLLFATAVGILSGFATTALLGQINHSLQAGELSLSFWAAFALLLVGGTCGQSLAGCINSHLGQRMIAGMRKELSARILQAPIGAIEQFRPHRMLAVLNDDVDTVSAFTYNFASYIINFSIALAGLLYLLYLSPLIFAISLLFLLGGMLLTGRTRRGWIADYQQVRHAQDSLQKQYLAIIQGAKELRLDRGRRAAVYHRGLSRDVDAIARLKGRAMTRMWIIDGVASALFFIAIALMLVGKPWLNAGQLTIGAAVIVLLYIKSPFDQLAGGLAIADQARIALRRLAELADSFQTPEPDILLDSPAPADALPLHSLTLQQLGWRYEGGQPFAIGPLDLTLRPGQITFITGDNGSGKTTLIKLLLGLYVPQQGAVLLNGQPVTDAQRDDYRQLFSTVFSDYFLFDELLHPEISTGQLAPLLTKLQLNGKVAVENQRFTTTELSTGQRKRLALLHAWLDDRPAIIFDEWAADQDPTFRQRFYTEFLPELKAQNKLVVAISHDDRYFSVADQLITLRNGEIVTQ